MAQGDDPGAPCFMGAVESVTANATTEGMHYLGEPVRGSGTDRHPI